MFNRLIPFLYCLSLLLAGGLTVTSVQADNSTGIRLGTTDFGGQSRADSGWSRPDPGSRSWSRQAPGERTWSRERKQSIDINKRHHTDHKPRLGEQHHDRDRHHKKHHRRHDKNLGGIRGHRSFGFSDFHQRRKHFRHHQPNPAFFYRDRGYGVNIYYAPDTYRDYNYEPSTVINGGYRETESAYAPEPETGIDPWDALADYQIHTARYAFEAQAQRQPHASLPRVGLALSTALAGDLDAGAFAMEDALLSDTSDLDYFNANDSVRLVVEELLLSYEGDPMMTASLHYLNRDYHAARRAVEVAAQYCRQCTAVENLAGLIAIHL